MVTAIVKKSCPYSKHKLWELSQVGFADPMDAPMEQSKDRIQTAEERDEIVRSLDIELWPWQNRCKCGRVREKDVLKANGGQCEKCRSKKNG